MGRRVESSRAYAGRIRNKAYYGISGTQREEIFLGLRYPARDELIVNSRETHLSGSCTMYAASSLSRRLRGETMEACSAGRDETGAAFPCALRVYNKQVHRILSPKF